MRAGIAIVEMRKYWVQKKHLKLMLYIFLNLNIYALTNF